MVDKISEFDFVRKSCFLYFHTIYNEFGDIVNRDQFEDGSLRLKAGEAYKIAITQNVLPPPESREAERDRLQETISLKLSFDQTLVQPIKGSGALSSRYDNLYFSFRTKEDVAGLGTMIEVIPEKPLANIFVPAITIQLSLRLAERRWLVLFCGMAIYVAASAWLPKIVPGISQVWVSILQAAGVVFIASAGKEFPSLMINYLVKTASRRLRQQAQEMNVSLR